MDNLVFVILRGSPIQRKCSDGGPFTDRTDGKPERADEDYELFPEAVMLTPEKNGGKWLFRMGSALLWEVAEKDVQMGQKRSFYDTGGIAFSGTGHIH